MKFDIYNSISGAVVESVRALNARQALCKYLMSHEDLIDMMLWKSCDHDDEWRLAEYDKEDEFLYAVPIPRSTTLWKLFLELPNYDNDIKVLDQAGTVILESYTSSYGGDLDDLEVIKVEMPERGSNIYTVTVQFEGDE